MIDRRTFSTALLAGAATSMISTRGMAANATPPKARNVVLVHGLFADGSSWSEVIPRLQAAGLNVTSVQNPLTTLHEAVASAVACARAAGRPDGSGRSFIFRHDRHRSRRASERLGGWSMWRHARQMRARTTRPWPRHFRHHRRPLGLSSTVTKDVSARLRSCAISRAICRKRRRRFSMRSRSRSTRLCSRARQRMQPGGRSRVSMPFRPKTGRSIPISNASWPSAWAPGPSK